MKVVKLTPALMSQLDATQIALDLVDGEAGIALALALLTIDTYVAEAATQHARMQRERQAVRRQLKGPSLTGAGDSRARWPRLTSSHAHRFRSVHFYLICWRMVSRHLALIREVSRLPTVGHALRPYARELGAYEAMRDHLEHFDERLPGRKNAGRLAEPNDLGNLLGDTLSFGGKRVDVGPNSLRLLKRIVDEVLAAFKIAAIQTIAAKRPERLHALFMPIRARRVDRQARRLVGRVRPPGEGGFARS